MIGFYTDNRNTAVQLLALWHDFPIELYDSTKNYDALLWLSQTPPPELPLIPVELNALPFTNTQWRDFIQRYLSTRACYQNNAFIFNADTRILKDLVTHQDIVLTEKETAFLAFLALQPNHQASKEAILASVWQYHPEAETHTLESHLYTLKQKIGPHVNQLICVHEGLFCLV